MAKFIITIVAFAAAAIILNSVAGSQNLPVPAEEFLENYVSLIPKIKRLEDECNDRWSCIDDAAKNDEELLALKTKYKALEKSLTDDQLSELRWRMEALKNPEKIELPPSVEEILKIYENLLYKIYMDESDCDKMGNCIEKAQENAAELTNLENKFDALKETLTEDELEEFLERTRAPESKR